MSDEKFMNRLKNSDNDTMWRAATVIENLENDLEKQGRLLYEYKLVFQYLPKEIWPYASFIWDQNTGPDELKAKIQAFTQKFEEQKLEKAS
jgi:hypothetical protein